MTSSRVTRRHFILSSVATTVAGLGVQHAHAMDISSPQKPESQVAFEVNGDQERGYGVEILYAGQRVARHGNGGEFSATFQNDDRSLEDRVENWRAQAWSGEACHITLRGICKLSNLNSTILVQVKYDAVTPGIARKHIWLRQVDSYVLRYQLTNCLESLSPGSKSWSFDQVECHGGPLHELFPAAGFRTPQGLTIGLLTDAGYRNQWSRIIRRDGKPLKPAPWRIPDVQLYRVGARDQSTNVVQIDQTFGEELVWVSDRHSSKAVVLPSQSEWGKRGEVNFEQRNGTISLTIRTSEAGVVIPFPAQELGVYSLHFRYRAAQAFSVQFWDMDERLDRLENISLYNDRVPESTEWANFETNVFFYSRRGGSGALFVSAAESEQATQTKLSTELRIELRDLELREMPARLQPYHRLEMDRPEQKTSFIFVDEHTPDTIRGYRLTCQQRLAEGLDFRGGDTEKVVYADLMMLSWAASPEYVKSMVAPSIWYSAAGEMYLRDSFFALNGIHNRDLNEGVFDLWAANQGSDGAINTLVEPGRANLERKANDSTPLWLMWALHNRGRFGTVLPMEKVQKAAEYFLRTYDRRHDATGWAQFVLGQLDVIDYPQGTSEICENQGVFAVTLRVIKELNIPGVSERISEAYIEQAESGYRSYYDAERRMLRAARNVTDAVGFGDLFPEFLSLWLLKRKILSDEMVINHLDRIPVLLPSQACPYPDAGGTVRPIFIGLKPGGRGWDYFTDTWHPMISTAHGANYANHNMDGIYYNGGSWMRLEICGYVTGKLHGWKKADQAIANRLWAEINTSADFPTSHEYLATDSAHPFFGYHRVFAWNAFVLAAMEMAGLRRPEMDPDYSKRSAE